MSASENAAAAAVMRDRASKTPTNPRRCCSADQSNNTKTTEIKRSLTCTREGSVLACRRDGTIRGRPATA